MNAPSKIAAGCLAIGLFVFDGATYGVMLAGLYTLKRAVGFDTFQGIDMVPDDAVEHAIASTLHGFLAALSMVSSALH